MVPVFLSAKWVSDREKTDFLLIPLYTPTGPKKIPPSLSVMLTVDSMTPLIPTLLPSHKGQLILTLTFINL